MDSLRCPSITRPPRKLTSHPVIFDRDLLVTIQQIGFAIFMEGQEGEFERNQQRNPAAGTGWQINPAPGVIARGIAERVDDYCAAAFVYCTELRPVPRVSLPAALADIGRRHHERLSPLERMLGDVGG